MNQLEFDKYGAKLRDVNRNPENWTLIDPMQSKKGTLSFMLQNIDNLEVFAIIKPRLAVGERIRDEQGNYFELVDIQLIKLEDITEEDAKHAGVEEIEGLGWKHYCPKKLFPPEVLKDQEPGFPYMDNARASFHTLWVKKYGLIDATSNPWIFRYELKPVTFKEN